MNDIIMYQRIASLIVKEQSGVIKEEEKEELSGWLSQSDKNSKLYNEIIKRDFVEDIKKYKEIDTLNALRKYKKRYDYTRKKFLIKWSAAAVVAIVMITTTWSYMNNEKPITSNDVFIAGTTKAELILSNGKVINLSDNIKKDVIVDDATIRSDGKQLSYTKLMVNSSIKTTAMIYNELHIPVGGEYVLVLEDGTKVWINSQSKLKYPVSFNNSERKVYLEGEAYFEVAKDSTRPFHVITKGDINVKVLGTSFNVRAYDDEHVVEAVLEEGVIQMNWQGDSLTLKPNNMSTYNVLTNKMEVRHIDTDIYTSWRNGEFIFTQETIESILNKLARWYDMDVVFVDDSVKNISFSGNFKRYDSVSRLLEAIEMAGGVKFQKKDNQLIVTNS